MCPGQPLEQRTTGTILASWGSSGPENDPSTIVREQLFREGSVWATSYSSHGGVGGWSPLTPDDASVLECGIIWSPGEKPLHHSRRPTNRRGTAVFESAPREGIKGRGTLLSLMIVGKSFYGQPECLLCKTAACGSDQSSTRWTHPCPQVLILFRSQSNQGPFPGMGPLQLLCRTSGEKD